MSKFSLVSLPPGPLGDPLWETAFAAEASADGSTGVIFIATKAGGYVVKASSQPAEQYFANLVLNHLGVPVPSSRVICHVDAEWSAVKAAIRSGAQRVRERGDASGADRVRMRLRGPLDRPQLLIMELIADAKQLEGNAHAATLLDPTGDCPLAASRLRAMGRCLAADVLLNYSDRIPAPCWDNEGNGGNILLTKGNVGFFAIDSGVTTISCATSYSTALRKEYIVRARTFLDTLCAGGMQEPFAFETIRKFVYSNTGHKLSDPALHQIQTGFLQVLSVIVKGGQDVSGSAFLEWLETQHKVVASGTITEDWGNVWKKSVAQIDMSFIREMVAVFCEAGNKYAKMMPDPEPIHVQQIDMVSNLSAREGDCGMSPTLWAALPTEIQSEFLSGDRHCNSHSSLENCDQNRAINPKWSRFDPQSFESKSSKVKSDTVDAVPRLEGSLQSPEPAPLPPLLSAKGNGKGAPPPLPVKCAKGTPPPMPLGKGKGSACAATGAPGDKGFDGKGPLPAMAAKGTPPPLPSEKGKGPGWTATNAPGTNAPGSKGSTNNNGKGPLFLVKGTAAPLPSGKGKGPAWTATNQDSLKSEVQSCKGSSGKSVPPPPLPSKAKGKGPLQKSNIKSSLKHRARGDKENRRNDMSEKVNCDDITKNAYPPQPTGLAVPSQSQRDVALGKRRNAEVAAGADMFITCHWSNKAHVHRVKPGAGLDTVMSIGESVVGAAKLIIGVDYDLVIERSQGALRETPVISSLASFVGADVELLLISYAEPTVENLANMVRVVCSVGLGKFFGVHDEVGPEVSDAEIVSTHGAFARCGNVLCSMASKFEVLVGFCQAREWHPDHVIFISSSAADVLKALTLGITGEQGKTDLVWCSSETSGHMNSCNSETVVIVSRLAALTQSLCACNARVSDSDGDPPTKVAVRTKERDPTRILLLQQAKARDAIAGAAVVDTALVNEEKFIVGQPSKIVVLPEGFVPEVLTSGAERLLQGSGGDAPPELLPYAAVAIKHQVYIVCGTMMELKKPGSEQWYTTTVVLGPDGRAVGAYRKRRIHDHQVQVAGDKPLTFDVPGFGRIGVLICLDAEDDALLEEMVALGVRCVVNPIHIPVPGLGAARGSKGLATGQWRVALASVARRFEWWSAQHGIFFARCDLAFPGGLGSSQVIGPEKTETISSMDSDVMTVSLTPTAANATNQLFVKVPSSSYLRSLQEENCGPRAKVARVCLKREEPVAVMRFCYPQGSPRGKLIVVFEDKSVCVIDIATLSIEETSAAILAPCHEQIEETRSRISVPSTKGPGAWLDDDCRCLLRINSAKQLEVVQCEAEGLPTPPLVVSATLPAERLAIDHLSGGFAVASSVVPHVGTRPDSSSNAKQNLRSSLVSFWSFSHNQIPAPLIDFMKE